MRSIIIGITAATMVAACSSAPKQQARTEQVCDLTSKTVSVTEDGKVVGTKSIDVMECNDNRLKRFAQVQVGISNNCGYFNGWMKKGGQDVQYRGISCQLPDGSWEIVDTGGR